MLIFLVPTALAGRWDGVDPDIHAERLVQAEPQAVFQHLLDLANLRAMFPTDCVGLWEPGERTFGEGANAMVRYDMAAMHRKLPMTLVHADAPRTVDLDHLGNRGFVTRFTLTAVEGGTKVAIDTPLNAPPWPFDAYYFKTVKPEWTQCYVRSLDNLATAVTK